MSLKLPDPYEMDLDDLIAEVESLRAIVFKKVDDIDVKYPLLTPYEKHLLTTLINNEGKTIIKEQLYNTIYIHADAEIKIIDVYICKIRGKYPELKSKIVTIWGVGYRYESDPEKAGFSINKLGIPTSNAQVKNDHANSTN